MTEPDAVAGIMALAHEYAAAAVCYEQAPMTMTETRRTHQIMKEGAAALEAALTAIVRERDLAMPESDAVASPDEFAAMLNAYTDGVSSLALTMATYGVCTATNDQKRAVADGYRDLCREYTALVRERDLQRPVVDAACNAAYPGGDGSQRVRALWDAVGTYLAATAPPDDAVHPADKPGG